MSGVMRRRVQGILGTVGWPEGVDAFIHAPRGSLDARRVNRIMRSTVRSTQPSAARKGGTASSKGRSIPRRAAPGGPSVAPWEITRPLPPEILPLEAEERGPLLLDRLRRSA